MFDTKFKITLKYPILAIILLQIINLLYLNNYSDFSYEISRWIYGGSFLFLYSLFIYGLVLVAKKENLFVLKLISYMLLMYTILFHFFNYFGYFIKYFLYALGYDFYNYDYSLLFSFLIYIPIFLVLVFGINLLNLKKDYKILTSSVGVSYIFLMSMQLILRLLSYLKVASHSTIFGIYFYIDLLFLAVTILFFYKVAEYELADVFKLSWLDINIFFPIIAINLSASPFLYLIIMPAFTLVIKFLISFIRNK